VLAVVTDKRLQNGPDTTVVTSFNAEVNSAQDYFAFGAIQNYRNFNSGKYRYGFNGKENDNEVKQDYNGNNNIGAQQDYGERIYDPRIGRFLSVDPITQKYPELTPYQFASNTPIIASDLDGREADIRSIDGAAIMNSMFKAAWNYLHNTTQIYSAGAGVTGGVAYGVNYAIRIGHANDVIGKTMFTSYSAINPFTNQNLDDGASNPQPIIGANAGGDISFQNSESPTFNGAFNAITMSMSSVSAKFGAGGGASWGKGNLALSVGLGIGGSFNGGNQSSLKSSYSVTYKEEDNITTKFAPNGYTDMRVINSIPIRDKMGAITGYKGVLQVKTAATYRGELDDKKWKTTDIKMFSGVNSEDKTSNDIWQSPSYHEEAEKVSTTLEDE
jgi:RHS repeat-associated protein